MARQLRVAEVFLLWMAGLLVLVLILSSAVVVWHDRRALENDLRREGRFLATALAAFLAPDIPAQRRLELERRFVELTPHLVAAEARAIDGGDVLWRFGPTPQEAQLGPGPTLSVVERIQRTSGDGAIEVRVVLSQTEMRAVLINGVTRLVLTLCAVLTLMLLVGGVQVREIVRPLGEMALRASQLGPGETFEPPRAPVRIRELDDLAQALYAMSRRLRVAGDELAASEKRYRELVIASPTPLVTVDRALQIGDANPAARELLGSERRLAVFMDEGDRQRLNAALVPSAEQGLDRVEVLWYPRDVAPSEDSNARAMDVFVQPLPGDDPRWLLGLHDVSERVRLLAERWQRTFDAMVDGVAVVDDNGHIVLSNKALATVAGRVRHELAEQTGPLGVGSDEWRFRQDGRTYHLRLTAGAAAGTKVLVVRDVTHVVEAEERLSAIEKMEIVAALSSGVAHDFNNLFTAILLHVRLIAKDPREAPEAAQAIRQLAEEGSELVSELVEFAADDSSPAGLLDLGAWLHSQRGFLGHLIPDHIDLTIETEGAAPPVACREIQLRRALFNLVLNSVQAIGAHVGAIRVAVRGAADDRVELTVRDSGPGFPEGFEARVLHPLTVQRHEGSASGIGLGLAVVIAAARSHGGEVEARRPRSGGAEVVLSLPVAKHPSHS